MCGCRWTLIKSPTKVDKLVSVIKLNINQTCVGDLTFLYALACALCASYLAPNTPLVSCFIYLSLARSTLYTYVPSAFFSLYPVPLCQPIRPSVPRPRLYMVLTLCLPYPYPLVPSLFLSLFLSLHSSIYISRVLSPSFSLSHPLSLQERIWYPAREVQSLTRRETRNSIICECISQLKKNEYKFEQFYSFLFWDYVSYLWLLMPSSQPTIER